MVRVRLGMTIICKFLKLVCYDVWGFAMTFGILSMTFRERQMISKIRNYLEIGFDSVCNDILPKRHHKYKRHRKPSRTLTIEHDPDTRSILETDENSRFHATTFARHFGKPL